MTTNYVDKLNLYGLDKIAFTFDVDEKHHRRMCSRLNKLLKGDCTFRDKTDIQVKCTLFNKKSMKRHYHSNYQIEMGSGFTKFKVIVSNQPRRDSMNNVRVEFNPNKAGRYGLIDIRRLITYLCGKAAVMNLYYNCKIRKAHVCIDAQVNMETIYPFYSGIRHSEIWRSISDVHESYIVGKGGSTKRFTIYDKLAEAAKRGSPILALDGPLYRLELQLCKQGFSMEKLHPNQFLSVMAKLEFFSDELFYDDYFTEHFLDLAWHSGINKALMAMSEYRRKRYREHLRTHYYMDFPFNLSEIEAKDFRRLLRVFRPKTKHNR